MPDFAHPEFLLLSLSVPLVVWWWLRRYRGALRFPNTEFLAGLPKGRSRIALWGGITMRALALLALVAALAGLRWPDLRTRIKTEGIAIVMVVDVSGSMAEPDFEWNGKRLTRLEAVKRAFGLFVAGGKGPGEEQLEGCANDLI